MVSPWWRDKLVTDEHGQSINEERHWCLLLWETLTAGDLKPQSVCSPRDYLRFDFSSYNDHTLSKGPNVIILESRELAQSLLLYLWKPTGRPIVLYLNSVFIFLLLGYWQSLAFNHYAWFGAFRKILRHFSRYLMLGPAIKYRRASKSNQPDVLTYQ